MKARSIDQIACGTFRKHSTQDGLIELRCGQWARKMVYFWDLISATFLIIQKFTIPQNVNNTSCSDIAEVYLVQFWEL